MNTTRIPEREKLYDLNDMEKQYKFSDTAIKRAGQAGRLDLP